MIVLPNLVGGIIGCAAKDNPRYAMRGVRVQELAKGRFRLEATDGRVLAIIRGTSHEWPAVVRPKIEDLPVFDAANEAIVPTELWKDVFKRKRDVLLVTDGKGVAFGCDGAILQGQVVEGRYPNIDGVLPKKGRLPRVVVRLDPNLLIRLLQVAASITDSQSPSVDLIIYSPNEPVGVTTRSPLGVTFDGIIMPIVPTAAERKAKAKAEGEEEAEEESGPDDESEASEPAEEEESDEPAEAISE